MSQTIHISTLTNKEYKNLKNFEITYGFTNSQFGPCLIGLNNHNLCFIAFYEEGKHNTALDSLKKDWPKAILKNNDDVIKMFAKHIFDNSIKIGLELNLLLKGTEFQVNVWKELIKVKPGSTTSYEAIAKAIGKPKAMRAVANSIAKNKIAYIIPCHRIIKKNGNISKYRWGKQRKEEILKSENA